MKYKKMQSYKIFSICSNIYTYIIHYHCKLLKFRTNNFVKTTSYALENYMLTTIYIYHTEVAKNHNAKS